jgi:hypothetical protein
LEDALVKAMKSALAVFSKEIKAVARDMATEFRRIGLGGLSDEMQDIITDTKRAANATRDFTDDMKALELRARAVGDLIAKTGTNPNIGASIETQLRRITQLQKEAEENSVELARNPQLVREYERRGDLIRTAISQDVKFVNKILGEQTQLQIEEERRRTVLVAGEQRQRTAQINAERSRNVVAQQRAGALELEESRRVSRLKLQDERATARQRLAIFQAVTQQIRVLERAIGATFRGAGSLLSTAAGAVSQATSRIGSIFRRSDAQLNDGLAPALNQRTSIFRRELRQTEQVIQSSTLRQSALLQRAELQASSGIAGVATGRSQLGSLLGGGLAIGGGFALITKLREGFQESVNLNESLNKTRQIFGTATDEIIEFADTSVEALFVTSSAALEAAANFGIFGKSAGLAGPELASFSKELTLLATDLASFNNTSIADATTAIAAALRGESEPIRKYGVLLNEAVLQQRAFDEKITDTIRKLTPQERVLAANAEILAQTAIQQGDAARTADDFANSSRRAGAASVEFFASIAKFAIPLATLLTNGILPVLNNLTDLVNNEVGPGLRVLRDGLIGAGAALGGLFAAKGAFEALKFLAIGVQALLTPMGLLVTAVGLVGAAVKILAERSPTLRAALDSLRDTVGDLVSGGLRLAGELFETLSNIVTERLLPAVERLASFVAANLQAAFRAAVGFVESRVIPVFLRLVGFVRDELLPPFLEFVGVVRDQVGRGLNAARDAAVAFFEAVQPFIDPMIAGFQRIGDAIQDVFRGNFDGALTRLQAFGREAVIVAGVIGTGIALAFVNPLLGLGVTIAGLLGVAFGPDLIDSLRPQVERFRKFLGGLFDIDFGNVATTFLRVVRRIGEIIGGIVTDRRFITAIAAIGGAAVAVGGAFILGFAQGVQDNIPELIDLLGDTLRFAFREAIKFAFQNPEVIVGALAGVAVLGAFRQAFARAGAASASSFVGSFVAGSRAFFAGSAFSQGLFGGFSGLEAAATRQAQREAAALSRARAAAGRDLALLGQTSTGPFVVGSGGAATTERDTVKQLDAVKAKFGEVQVAGALLRENVNRTFGSIGVAAGGLGRVISGDIRGGLQQARAGFSGFAGNVRQTLSRLRTDLTTAGGSLGVAIGGAIAGGIGAALSGQATAQASGAGGKALGIAGIITSALFASAAFGGLSNPVGQTVAGVTAAIGVATAVFGDSGRAAKEAEDRIKDYALALDGVVTAAEFVETAVGKMNARLLDLPESTSELLAGADITVQSLSRSIRDGTVDLPDLEARLRAAAESSGAGWVETAGAIDFVRTTVVELQRAQGRLDLKDAVNEPVVSRALEGVTSRVEGLGQAILDLPGGGIAQFVAGNEVDTINRRIEDTATAIDDVGSAIDDLNQKRTDQINAQLSTISDTLAGVRESAQLATDAITSPFDRGSGTSNALRDQLLGQISGIGQEVGESLVGDVFAPLNAAQFGTATRGFTEAIQDIIRQAVLDNPDITNAELADLLAPVLGGISQAVALDPADMFDEAAGNELANIVNGILADSDFEARVDFAQGLQDEATKLQDQWNALNVQLEADVTFSTEQIRRALIDAGLTPEEAARALGLTGTSGLGPGFDVGQAIGGEISAGVADGVLRGIPTAEDAVSQIATQLKARMQKDLEIESPSKVFRGLGIEIPAGLAQGILEGIPTAAVALRELNSEVFNRLVSVPGTLAENFARSFEAVPNNIQTISESIGGFVSEVSDAIIALEGLAGVDFSKLEVGLSDATNPLSNAGRTADQFANDLRVRLQGQQPHPAGWIQTEDGTWVPPEFFNPPPSLGQAPTPFGDVREGQVAAQSVASAVRIDTVNITEATNARATARETVMALKTAPFTSAPLSTARRIPADVVA